MGQTVAALWASWERWLIDSLGHMNTTQHRYRLGVFPVPHGSVDSKMFPSSDPLMPAALRHGNVALCQILCWFFYVAEEGSDTGFVVRGQDVHLTSQSLVGHEDLGELLPASASLDHRTELVLETTVDDISQRKVGQNGRVRITVDMPESVIPEATSHSCNLVSFLTLCYDWVAPLSIRGTVGRVVFSAHQRSVVFWSCFVRVTEMGPCRHFYRSAFRCLG